jgi:hypothetical protein
MTGASAVRAGGRALSIGNRLDAEHAVSARRKRNRRKSLPAALRTGYDPLQRGLEVP